MSNAAWPGPCRFGQHRDRRLIDLDGLEPSHDHPWGPSQAGVIRSVQIPAFWADACFERMKSRGRAVVCQTAEEAARAPIGRGPVGKFVCEVDAIRDDLGVALYASASSIGLQVEVGCDARLGA